MGAENPVGPVILVVDDEPAVLALTATMLGRAGYRVLEAEGGEEALILAAQPASQIDLLLTDVMMPGMNGYELGERLQTERPDVKIVYMSGFTDQILMESTGRAVINAPFLRKPFTQHRLVTKITEVLKESPLAI